MQRVRLAPDYEISRVIRGGWQMASGHGKASSDEAIEDMTAFADAGINTFDCADIYTGVEELIGRGTVTTVTQHDQGVRNHGRPRVSLEEHLDDAL